MFRPPRRLSGAAMRLAKAQGFRLWWLLYYILGPIIFLPFLAGMASGVSILGLKANPPEARIVFLATFCALYALIFWYIYILPCGDRLALHEGGLHIRLSLKQRRIPLAVIESIFVGRTISKSEAGLRQSTGYFIRNWPNGHKKLDRTAMTVRTHDGSVHTFKVLLTRFESADIEELLMELVKRNPRLGAPIPE